MSKKKAITLNAICFLFILLFTYAALSKLMEYREFVSQIGQSYILTDFAELLAWLIPVSELAVAAMIAIPKLRYVGLYAGFTIMVLFTIYIGAILQFSTDVPCSCGGILEKLGWTEHLIFNMIYVILGGAGIYLSNPSNEPTNIHNRTGPLVKSEPIT